MLDFGALPPEVNSGRMYVGAGSGPLLAAAAAWDELAAGLGSAATAYGATIDGLTAGPWTGPSTLNFSAAIAPYVAWMRATGALAEQSAVQARLAAGAYHTAFAATVPPPAVEANRALLATLVATNILGQNTPAIASTETLYMEMWAQDATAMYAYAAASGSASQLSPFIEPPQTTDSSAGTAQSAAVSRAVAQSASSDAAQLSQAVASAPGTTGAVSVAATAAAEPVPPLLAAWEQLNYIFDKTLGGPFSYYGINDRGLIGPHWLLFGLSWAAEVNGIKVGEYFAGPKPVIGALAPLINGIETVPYVAAPDVQNLFASAKNPVSAAMGTARGIGGLSVPTAWTQTAPIQLVARTLPASIAAAPAGLLAGETGVFSQMALSSLAGRGVAAAARSSHGGGAARGAFADRTQGEADPAAATIIVIPATDDE